MHSMFCRKWKSWLTTFRRQQAGKWSVKMFPLHSIVLPRSVGLLSSSRTQEVCVLHHDRGDIHSFSLLVLDHYQSTFYVTSAESAWIQSVMLPSVADFFFYFNCFFYCFLVFMCWSTSRSQPSMAKEGMCKSHGPIPDRRVCIHAGIMIEVR